MFSTSSLLAPNEETSSNRTNSVRINYAGSRFINSLFRSLEEHYEVELHDGIENLSLDLFDRPLHTLPDALLIEVDSTDEAMDFVGKARSAPLLRHIIIVLLVNESNNAFSKLALTSGVNDIYSVPFPVDDIVKRISFLVEFEQLKPKVEDLGDDLDLCYRQPFGKRLFDVMFAIVAILILSPVFLLIALLIKLESRGPAIYISKRVGAGYKIFDFYKFRSMRADADSQLQKLSDLNQYKECNTAFVKLKNDPRVTRIGRLLRNTSLDELPQLFNVLLGDMSIVGNRPLPLYEAELLTSNEWALRFLGPAGLTGLWQVSKRGNEDMSDRERKRLDNFYAKNYSFWLDIKIILMTLPAMIQKEKV